MISKVLLTTLVSSIFCCPVYAQKYYYSPVHSTILDTSKGARCLHQCSRQTPDVNGFYKIDTHDSLILVTNFKKILLAKDPDAYPAYARVKSLDNFYYQYMGVIIHHKKYIYINAFTTSPYELSRILKKWRTVPTIICGGGPGYWGILFDIAGGSFSRLEFNGPM